MTLPSSPPAVLECGKPAPPSTMSARSFLSPCGASRMKSSISYALSEFQKLLCEQREQVAGIVTRESGKPRAEALSTEVLVVLDCVNYLAEYLPAFLRPEPIPHSNLIMKLKRGKLLREPYGVVGII